MMIKQRIYLAFWKPKKNDEAKKNSDAPQHLFAVQEIF